MTTPANYYRQNKRWHLLIGRTGKVLLVTTIRVAEPELEIFAPYDFCLVQIGSKKLELMAAVGEKLAIGDKVKCVLRKNAQDSAEGLISYGIKVVKI